MGSSIRRMIGEGDSEIIVPEVPEGMVVSEIVPSKPLGGNQIVPHARARTVDFTAVDAYLKYTPGKGNTKCTHDTFDSITIGGTEYHLDTPPRLFGIMIPNMTEYRGVSRGQPFHKITVKRGSREMIEREFKALAVLGQYTPKLVAPVIFSTQCSDLVVHGYWGYKSLADLRTLTKIPSSAELLELAISGLEMIWKMHALGMVHGAINWFTIRTGKDEIRLVDFYMSSDLYVRSDGTLRGLDGPTRETGYTSHSPLSYKSLYYLSDMLSGYTESEGVLLPSRRDDLINFAEAILMLAGGDRGVFDPSVADNMREIFDRKRSIGLDALRVDPKLYTFYRRCRELEFSSTPDYARMIADLRRDQS